VRQTPPRLGRIAFLTLLSAALLACTTLTEEEIDSHPSRIENPTAWLEIQGEVDPEVRIEQFWAEYEAKNPACYFEIAKFWAKGRLKARQTVEVPVAAEQSDYLARVPLDPFSFDSICSWRIREIRFLPAIGSHSFWRFRLIDFGSSETAPAPEEPIEQTCAVMPRYGNLQVDCRSKQFELKLSPESPQTVKVRIRYSSTP
jgi:hypothetical protein